ncbi:hypothetical protein TUM4438_24830 [Shewanella sairae]|uniref:Uncharacterized protein n=1 Tax=Shewanella sairae TaxID=190310 RepID=A0ABQ4PHL3_9GAMM|nr:DUF6508 domain-containing protein [Shewanella sairae]MCL1131301.1 DUF6508 domain-containing protein [Shewanella sairae]GIU47043.1 hypothetical protein TUM4438_24830 [Shewanella sairae]
MNNMDLQNFTARLYTQYINDLKLTSRFVSDTRLHELFADLDAAGVLLADFNWDEWYQNSHMVDRPEYIGDASFYECQLLLTAMARIDRFSPGVLSNMRRQGVLLAIIERFQTLYYQKAM